MKRDEIGIMLGRLIGISFLLLLGFALAQCTAYEPKPVVISEVEIKPLPKLEFDPPTTASMPTTETEPIKKEEKIQITGKPIAKSTSPLYNSSSLFKKPARLPYRELLLSSDKSPDSYRGLQSFVVFTHRPVSSDEHQRYIDTCKRWIAELETLSNSEKMDIRASGISIAPLYWPTKTGIGSCETNFIDYDFVRAKTIAAKLGRGSEPMRGPLLVMQRANDWAILDISRFTPPEVERAFTTWKQQVCKEEPTSGFGMTKFREYFRALIQTYGETILGVIEKPSITK